VPFTGTSARRTHRIDLLLRAAAQDTRTGARRSRKLLLALIVRIRTRVGRRRNGEALGPRRHANEALCEVETNCLSSTAVIFAADNYLVLTMAVTNILNVVRAHPRMSVGILFSS